jgi:hypothetical protein
MPEVINIQVIFETHITVDCPHCGFRWGTIDKREIRPQTPISFVCRRTCHGKWDIAITEEAYRKELQAWEKVYTAKQLLREAMRVLPVIGRKEI